MPKRSFSTIAILAFLTAMSQGAAAQDDLDLCAQLVASPFDPETRKGAGVEYGEIDAPRAVEACAKAATASDVTARTLYHLGRAYDANQQYDLAMQAYGKSESAGSSMATYEIGELYHYGLGVEADQERALAQYLKAYETSGLPIAANVIGYSYERGEGVEQDYDVAIEYYRLASEAGLALANNSLGLIYMNGVGIPADYPEAERLFRLAADAGYADALNNLGRMNIEGQSSHPSAAAAAAYYREASALGHGWATANLAILYSTGNGVERDRTEARRLFMMAMAGEDVEASANAHNGLAWMNLEDNIDLSGSEALALKATELVADNANYLDTLAWARHLQGDDAGALLPAERSFALVDGKTYDGAGIAAHMGDIYDALGRTDDAAKAYRRALDLALVDISDPLVDLEKIKAWLAAH